MELDELDRKAATAFEGYMVRKDLVRKFSRQFPVPTYVVEFMLGRYCATIDENEIQEGLAIVQRQLSARTVKAGEEELFKAGAYKDGNVKLIDMISVRFSEKDNGYVATLPSLRLRLLDDFEGAGTRTSADERVRRRRRPLQVSLTVEDAAGTVALPIAP